ncbi:MAG TPA: ABC transporter permease [Verrucomicrobiae bacterium]|nr:ABC transporter permease [Verrucomicrobiae bacterium]
MTAWIKVARYHMADPIAYLVGPWAILAFAFLINLVITKAQGGPNPTKALAVVYVCFFGLGILSTGRSLPFGLALGATRRSYYTGTALLAAALAAADGLGLALLQLAERATHGWGVALHFFEVSHILAGPWYVTWLTSFVGLTLLFVYGIWYGIIYRRWHRLGLVAFIVGQVAVIRVWIVVVDRGHNWGGAGFSFTPSAMRITAMFGALAAVLLIGGFALMRRVTV